MLKSKGIGAPALAIYGAPQDVKPSADASIWGLEGGYFWWLEIELCRQSVVVKRKKWTLNDFSSWRNTIRILSEHNYHDQVFELRGTDVPV